MQSYQSHWLLKPLCMHQVTEQIYFKCSGPRTIERKLFTFTFASCHKLWVIWVLQHISIKCPFPADYSVQILSFTSRLHFERAWSSRETKLFPFVKLAKNHEDVSIHIKASRCAHWSAESSVCTHTKCLWILQLTSREYDTTETVTIRSRAAKRSKNTPKKTKNKSSF